MSVGYPSPKLPLWADFSFLTQASGKPLDFPELFRKFLGGSPDFLSLRETMCESGRCIDALKKRRREGSSEREGGFLSRGGGFLNLERRSV